MSSPGQIRTVSPLLPFIFRTNNPDAFCPKSYKKVSFPSRIVSMGSKTSMIFRGQVVSGTNLPPGGFTIMALVQPESSNPGLSHPSCSIRAS